MEVKVLRKMVYKNDLKRLFKLFLMKKLRNLNYHFSQPLKRIGGLQSSLMTHRLFYRTSKKTVDTEGIFCNFTLFHQNKKAEKPCVLTHTTKL